MEAVFNTNAKTESQLKKYFLTPFLAGIIGFIVFSAIVTSTLFITSHFLNLTYFSYGEIDILIGLNGFVIFFWYTIRKNIAPKS